MTQRQLRVYVRQPAFAFKGGVVELGGFGTTSYLDYPVPGVVVMSALSCNMGAGVTALDEIQRGTLTRFLTTPVSRAALMNGAPTTPVASAGSPCWCSPRCCSAQSSGRCPTPRA
ncbi:hypothetical protein SALBM311S_04492 [Streptomyces alboniger]